MCVVSVVQPALLAGWCFAQLVVAHQIPESTLSVYAVYPASMPAALQTAISADVQPV
jgi:hypothetical protein